MWRRWYKLYNKNCSFSWKETINKYYGIEEDELYEAVKMKAEKILLNQIIQ